MKVLRIIAQIIGYIVIALAAVLLVAGEPGGCFFLLVSGLVLLFVASRNRPKAPPSEPEELTEEEKAGRAARIADAKAKGVACCPYCGSTSILIAYGKLDGRIQRCTCVSCGREFMPGQKP